MKEMINIGLMGLFVGTVIATVACSVAWLGTCFILWHFVGVPSVLIRLLFFSSWIGSTGWVAVNADDDMPRLFKLE